MDFAKVSLKHSESGAEFSKFMYITCLELVLEFAVSCVTFKMHVGHFAKSVSASFYLCTPKQSWSLSGASFLQATDIPLSRHTLVLLPARPCDQRARE